MSEEKVEAQVETQVEAPEATAETAEAPKGPDLNISDLVAIKNIMEVASQRGAFKATELEAVGKTFNKLNTFLEAVSNKEE